MKLRTSPTSPYARKVAASIIELDLGHRVQLVNTNPWSSDTDLPRDNPLGKVPALLCDDGSVLFDSPVICEYLASLADDTGLFPPAGQARWQALRLQALADGIMDASVLRLLESRRPESRQSDDWIQRQRAVAQRALDGLEQEVGTWGASFTIGQLSAACALGYQDLRFADDHWRDRRPQLADWFARVSQRPSLLETVPREP